MDEVERKRQKAVAFLEDVVGEPDRADEFDSMTTREYADHIRPTQSVSARRGLLRNRLLGPNVVNQDP